MTSNLLKIILLNLGLIFNFFIQAQNHEIGIYGGGLHGYSKGKANSKVTAGGWNVGGYYRYTFNKWIATESGIDYTRKKLEFGGDLWENSLSVPLNLIVFPSFRFSLVGGFYLKNRLGTNILSSGKNSITGKRTFYQVEKKPAWGIAAGAKWNMKYCRLVIFCKQDLTSWVKDFQKVWNYVGWPLKEPFKSFSVHITAEIPLWQNKKK